MRSRDDIDLLDKNKEIDQSEIKNILELEIKDYLGNKQRNSSLSFNQIFSIKVKKTFKKSKKFKKRTQLDKVIRNYLFDLISQIQYHSLCLKNFFDENEELK